MKHVSKKNCEKRRRQRRRPNAIVWKWKKLHNQAFLFMFSKIREIVLRLFLFYFIWIEMERAHLNNSSQKMVCFIFFLVSMRVLSPRLSHCVCLCSHTCLYGLPCCTQVCGKDLKLNTHRQTNGNKIKITFSILYTQTQTLSRIHCFAKWISYLS